jgi:DNA-binding response OmpR family regulator
MFMAKILIIDDDPDFVNATKIVLEKNNYEVKSASSGNEGVICAKNEKPDLVEIGRAHV